MWTCAVFDCDGVLLDSNPVKVEAFRVALADEPSERVETLVARHRASGGVSRFAKLEAFYREIHPVAEPELAVAAALARFARASRAGLRTCAEVPGAGQAIEVLGRAGVPIHVISGGEQIEVAQALAPRPWSRWLAGIHGSPTTKADHLERLFASGELVAGGVYLGDAELDMRMAEDFGLAFVFVAGFTDWSAGRVLAARRGHRVVEDLRAFAADPRAAPIRGS